MEEFDVRDIRPDGMKISHQLTLSRDLIQFCLEYSQRDPVFAQALSKIADQAALTSALHYAKAISTDGQEAIATDYVRWFFTSRMKLESWDDRKRMIAAQIPATARVWDIGAGNRNLEHLLPDTARYCAIDCVQSHPDTFVCDYNYETRFPAEDCDVVVMSGFLEYLRDMDGFLDALTRRCHGATVLFSWALSSSFPDLELRKRGWINPQAFDDEGLSYFSSRFDHLERIGTFQNAPVYRAVLKTLG